ncbi:MAG: PadR family transcriptional regulator [Candidatus Methanofastidiosa archaeon]|jgi:DNA-binding PadR family transcriptional regulator|nr:PadR family transcriptional regulator [Candidatus Methanofastidiosa archaeon]
MPLERLKQKLTKEVMWIYVLKLLQQRPMYGYEIKAQIEKNFGWSPATITSYVVLYKLESGGYVTTEVRDDEAGKMKRKYYLLTKEGKALLDEGKTFIRQVLNIIQQDE